MLTARCVLPVPIGPAMSTFSPRAIQSQRASSAIFGALTPSAAPKSNWSSVFISGKAAACQPLLDGGLGARSDLGREHLVQVVLVRPVLLACLAGEVLEGARQAGHLELARLRAKNVGDDGGAAHSAPPRRRS